MHARASSTSALACAITSSNHALPTESVLKKGCLHRAVFFFYEPLLSTKSLINEWPDKINVATSIAA